MKYSKLIKKLNDQERTDLKFVLKLAKSCNFENRHTKHVTKLALKIFDDLQDLHGLGPKEKFSLLCAGILHDIGVHTEGPKDHHKIALRIILESPILQFDDKTRFLIGSIARYHRGVLPDVKHDHFKALSPKEREIVLTLSAILRVSDGLDYSHNNWIRDIRGSFSKEAIKFDCLVKKAHVNKEISAAGKKGDLLRKIFKRDLKFKVLTVEEFTGWS
jgi:exopolyphosphatase/guanosine-5'-triphosphate,3'-diphosphate pyrophosphatase